MRSNRPHLGVYARRHGGTWTREAPAADAAGGGGRGGFGQDVTITQTATAITLEYAQGPTTVARTFALDGSESRNAMLGRGGGEPTTTTIVDKKAM